MNTHNKTGATKNQQQNNHNQIQLVADDQTETQHVYALQVIDDQSVIDGDSTNEGDITEYLTHTTIIGKDDDDDGTTSESEGQLMHIYDVGVLDAIKGPNVKRKFLAKQHEITIAESDPIELLTFEDELE